MKKLLHLLIMACMGCIVFAFRCDHITINCIYLAENDGDGHFDEFKLPECQGAQFKRQCFSEITLNGVRFLLVKQVAGEQSSSSICPHAHDVPGFPSDDCDDNNSNRFPGNEEICSNGLDEDCNGADFQCGCLDNDGDGHFAANCGGDDCDDSNNQRFPGNAENCADGIDNDCDGDVDCNDFGDCNGTPECAAQCVPEGLSESLCADGLDNDCDGLFDCADPDCFDEICGPNFERCVEGRVCECPVLPETSCANGISDDCDALVDCDDPDCNNRSCGPNGLTCSGGVCGCPTGSTETQCEGGADNDCDGLADCDDPDCLGQICGPAGVTCDIAGNCTCPGETTETLCADGEDNDCDQSIDCDDPDCSGDPECISGAENCTNGIDDDGDSFIDCADGECAGQVCSPIGSNYLCSAGSCVCTPTEDPETTCGDGADNDCSGITDCGGEFPCCDFPICFGAPACPS